MKEEKLYFENSDGLKLCGILTYPEKDTKTCIVLCHGITVDKDESGIFSELAQKLAEEGFAVFRFDFRGHGESEGDSVDMTVMGEKRDIEAAFNFLKSKGFEKFGLLAASFGGGPTIYFTAENQNLVKALCLWNPVINYESLLNPKLPWPRKYFGPEQMKKLEEQGYILVSKRNFKVGKKLIDEIKNLKPYEKLKEIEIPILFVHGDADTYVPYEDSVMGAKLAKNAELFTIKGAEHGFHEGEEGKIADEVTIEFFKKWLE